MPEVWMNWTIEKAEYVLLSVQESDRQDAEEMRGIASKVPVQYTWGLNR